MPSTPRKRRFLYKVCDFGLSRTLTETEMTGSEMRKSMTLTACIGTPVYMVMKCEIEIVVKRIQYIKNSLFSRRQS